MFKYLIVQWVSHTFLSRQVYANYNDECTKQVKAYDEFHGPVRRSTVCRMAGCRRFSGRKGFIFCSEGCTDCDRKAGEPAPALEVQDFDDDHDASSLLMKILGPPPPNVVIRRWRWDPEANVNMLEIYPPGFEEEPVAKEEDAKDV